MKKMTKILSLVLAIALVLGMTASATAISTPTQIVFYEDFAAFAENGFNTFSSTYSEMADTAFDTASTEVSVFGESPTNTKFYKKVTDKIPQFVTSGGKTKMVTNKAEFQYGYRPPENWTYSTQTDALVLAYSKSLEYTGLNTGYDTANAEIKLFTKNKTADATNLDGNHPGYEVDTDDNLILTAKTMPGWGHKFTLVATDSTGYIHAVTTGNNWGKTAFGEDEEITVMYAPWQTGAYWTNEGTPTTYLTMAVIGDKYLFSGYNSTERVEELDGLFFRSLKEFNTTVNYTMLYKVSGDISKFAIENSNITNQGVSDPIEIVFSQPVLAGKVEPAYQTASGLIHNAIAISDGTNNLVAGTDFTVDVDHRLVGNEIKGVVTITPAADLKYGENYTITFDKAATWNITHRRLTTNNVVSMATEATPVYNITLSANEGLNTTGTAITDLAAAEGKTVYFSANATNATGRAVKGVIAIGIYDAEGNLVRYAYSNKSFDTAGSKSFGAAFKIGTGFAAKAYVVDTASESTVID